MSATEQNDHVDLATLEAEARQEHLAANPLADAVLALIPAARRAQDADEDADAIAAMYRDTMREKRAAEATLEKVRAYADERAANGRRGRQVHSARIASDLHDILGAPPAKNYRLARAEAERDAAQAALAAAQAEAWQQGASAGWGASGEGWNNEHATGTDDSTWDGMARAHPDYMPRNPYVAEGAKR